MSVCACVRVYVCMYVYTYIYIHTYMTQSNYTSNYCHIEKKKKMQPDDYILNKCAL